jgi:hypothetical protein
MKSAAQQGVGTGPVRFRSTWAQWAWAARDAKYQTITEWRQAVRA